MGENNFFGKFSDRFFGIIRTSFKQSQCYWYITNSNHKRIQVSKKRKRPGFRIGQRYSVSKKAYE